jgi:Zn-dependent protease with chaperone function
MISSFQTLAQVFTGRLLNTFFEGVAIAILPWAVLRLAGRQNSGTRFALWLAALGSIVMLPLFAGSDSAPAVAAFAVQRAAEFNLPGWWALVLFCAWAAISALLLVRLAVGVWRLGKFRARCSEIDVATLDPSVAELFQQLAPGRRVKFCVSDAIAIPSVIGFFRPAVVFPSWLVPGLSLEELKTVLGHELAHLRRRDDWSNLFQKIVKALFFFHPAVWWIENQLSLEREMACDDMVLAQNASPRAYAASHFVCRESSPGPGIRFGAGLHRTSGTDVAQDGPDSRRGSAQANWSLEACSGVWRSAFDAATFVRTLCSAAGLIRKHAAQHGGQWSIEPGCES